MYNRQEWFESPVQAAPTLGLGSMGLAGAIVTWDASGNPSVWARIDSSLDQALQTAAKVTDQNGKPIVMSQFQGGWLANGCPLNVYFGQAWISGQQDALRAAGMTQCLPAAPLTTGTVPQSVTTLPPGGPAFTTTLTQGGIITTPGPTAPQQVVNVPGAPTPTLPIDSTQAALMTQQAEQQGIPFLPEIIIGVVALIILTRK